MRYENFSRLPWRERGFYQYVQQMAGAFGAEFDLPAVHQLGVMVPDVEAAATELERQGMARFFVAGGTPRYWREDGVCRAMSGKLGMAYCDGIEIELLEPGRNSNWYRDSLAAGGNYAIQHLGYLVGNVDLAAAPLQAAGFPLKVRGRLNSRSATLLNARRLFRPVNGSVVARCSNCSAAT